MFSFVKIRLAKLKLFFRHWISLPCYAIFLLVKCTAWAIQSVTWRINGVQKFREEIYKGEIRYEKSAQILTVLATCKWSQLDKARDKWHYLTVHHSFANPDIVLSDDVMLIDVTPTNAVFARFPKSLCNYTVKNVKFMFIESVTKALQLIEMPLESFQKLADKLGDPTVRYDRITFLFGVGRCGSTVVARMLEEADPEGIVFSEPPTLMEFVYYSKVADKQFFTTQLRNALYVLLKPISNKKRIYLKLTFISTHNAKDIHTILPKARYLFIHRDPLSVVRSQERAFGYSVMMRSLYWAISSRIFPILEKKYGLRRNPLLEYAYCKLKNTVFEYWIYIYADLWISYELQAESFDFPLVIYDELFENSEQFCSKILKLVHLPQFKLAAALSALRTDSQEDTVLGQRALRNIPTTVCNAKLKFRTDVFCDILNLPRFKWENDVQVSSFPDVTKLLSLQNGFKLIDKNC